MVAPMDLFLSFDHPLFLFMTQAHALDHLPPPTFPLPGGASGPPVGPLSPPPSHPRAAEVQVERTAPTSWQSEQVNLRGLELY